ncbi:helix-turn-helix domain-containing protein [Sporosarcina siberiensis]|uniref:Helix-turn-helix domain-containing protein n=1 Tax=Sporosarcina siberiensis TaxID=1365606 RepID=A0ABW4SE02_9BACL
MSYQDHEKAIQKSLNFIERHLTDKLQLHLLAEQAGYSRFHFQRIFRKIIGKSIAEYIRERRLTQSARILITSDQRIIDIAMTYRFNSQESFTRAFKKVYDITPGHYRKLLRKIVSKGEFIVSTENNTPTGWIMTGETPFDYETGLDNRIVHNGNYSAYLRSKDEKARGFATLMQQIKSDRYRGERVRFSAFVKSTDVKEAAGLWMRVDHSSGEVLAFDNMMNRPIKGTNEWNHFSVVLDIPVKSEAIAFGVLLNGSGHIWMDKLGFEVVDDSVPVTEKSSTEGLSHEPLNLNFEDNNIAKY